MLYHLRQIDAWQWIMVACTLAIACFMLLAHSANAYSGHPAATTLSHCGWLPLPPARHYTHHPRSVRIIQHKLESLGYSVGAPGVDGKFGNLSRNAVKAYQTRYQLATTGDVDGATAAMLAYHTHAHPNVRRCQRPHHAR